MDEPTGVAKDQKQTPKKPYNTDKAICTKSGSRKVRVSLGGTYDPGVVVDKVPDEQLYETREEDDSEHGIRRPNPISEKSGAATADSG